MESPFRVNKPSNPEWAPGKPIKRNTWLEFGIVTFVKSNPELGIGAIRTVVRACFFEHE